MEAGNVVGILLSLRMQGHDVVRKRKYPEKAVPSKKEMCFYGLSNRDDERRMLVSTAVIRYFIYPIGELILALWGEACV